MALAIYKNPQGEIRYVEDPAGLNKSLATSLESSGYSFSGYQGQNPDYQAPNPSTGTTTSSTLTSPINIPTVDAGQSEADRAQTLRDQFSAQLQASKETSIASERAKYETLRNQQKDINKRSLEAIRIVGIRNNLDKYAPEIATGVLSAEESAGLRRIEEINANEASAIAAIQSATDAKQWALVQDRINTLETIRKEKNQAQIELNKIAVENNNKLEQVKKQNTILGSVIADISSGKVTFQSLWDKYKNSGIDPKQVLDLIGEYQKVDPNAYQSAAGKEYADYVKAQKAAGGTPVDWNTYQTLDANRKAVVARASSSGLSIGQQGKVLQIAGQFDNEPIIKSYNEVINKAQTIKQIIDAGVGGPGDLAIVYEFMKALDPTSVVRESEYANAAKAGNIFLGVYARFNGYLKAAGGFLPKNVKESFLKIINIKLNAYESQFRNLYNEYGRRINKLTGLTDGTDYITDYSKGLSNNVQNNSPQEYILQSPSGSTLRGVLTPSELQEAFSQGYVQIQ